MLRRRKFFTVVLSFLCLGFAAVADAQTKPPVIEWQTDSTIAQELALKSKRPLLVFASAEWCSYCQKMKREVWSNADVIRQVREQFIPLHLDADKYPDVVAEMQVEAFPTTLVLSPSKAQPEKLVGYVSVSQQQTFLNRTNGIKSKLPSVARR
ncbi:MAG: thioredoxin family protein [Planctomycetia bacterium]|nr:thioredoxin family protein [Planctomycetia bacterium]